MSSFCERFKELRDSTGKTQAKIAEELSLTPQALSYYANGREPGYDTLIALASYFHVSTDYLLGHSDYKREESALRTASSIGLSESSIDILEWAHEHSYELISTINMLIEEERPHTIDRDHYLEHSETNAKKIPDSRKSYYPIISKIGNYFSVFRDKHTLLTITDEGNVVVYHEELTQNRPFDWPYERSLSNIVSYKVVEAALLQELTDTIKAAKDAKETGRLL